MNEALESKKRRNNLRAFMVKVDQAEAEPTRATEIASFMVVLLMLGSDGKISKVR